MYEPWFLKVANDRKAEVDELRAENAKLRDALKPFALMANEPHMIRTLLNCEYYVCNVTGENLRKARAALKD